MFGIAVVLLPLLAILVIYSALVVSSDESRREERDHDFWDSEV